MRDAHVISRITELQDERNHQVFLELLDRKHPPVRGDRRHVDVPGFALDELVRRLAGESIAFSLTADQTWSAMSLSGEYSAHGDTLDEVLEQLLEQLPRRGSHDRSYGNPVYRAA